MLPKELHQLKYEAISAPQGSVRLVKKTQERKSSTCYLLITKDVTSSSPVPLKTRRGWGGGATKIMIENWVTSIESLRNTALECLPRNSSSRHRSKATGKLRSPCPFMSLRA
ncbi:uncharacterized protein TNCV_1863051 [Trichonephila clavipes]|nr:uncharacterized protein TNCV_1863051 [Trichonephila clavipes]